MRNITYVGTLWSAARPRSVTCGQPLTSKHIKVSLNCCKRSIHQSSIYLHLLRLRYCRCRSLTRWNEINYPFIIIICWCSVNKIFCAQYFKFWYMKKIINFTDNYLGVKIKLNLLKLSKLSNMISVFDASTASNMKLGTIRSGSL